MTHRDIIKLNLGCGPSGIDGWINYDWGMLPFLSKLTYIRNILININILPKNYEISWPKISLVDIRKKLPLEDNSVDYIYCSHVLEHFEKYETINILKECKRILKNKGVLRIVLPDLRKMISNYKNADEFNKEFFGYDKDVRSGLKIFIRGHQWMYDELSTTKILKEIFKKVDLKNFIVGNFPDLEKLELMSQKDHSLYIEATK